ncbi:MAG: GNAT family N-acetyltransferase [Eubacteriales bacterium]|nr:GNAT family N-acetyltransferase [Eubacteriales bacterium]
MSKVIIRVADKSDAPELLEIYRHYVENTAITAEVETPSILEFKARLTNTLKKYPYIVATDGDTIYGYAYTGPFKARAGYNWDVETSIYLNAQGRSKGLGRELYKVLEEVSRAQGIINMNACIAYPVKDDEHLTKNSAQFHEHVGFSYVGEFHMSMYKFGKWYNTLWMEKAINGHPDRPAPVTPFPDLSRDVLKRCGITF